MILFLIGFQLHSFLDRVARGDDAAGVVWRGLFVAFLFASFLFDYLSPFYQRKNKGGA